MNKGRKLKEGLYGVPILLVFFLALIVYAVFQIVVRGYIANLAAQNIEARFARLDAYHQGQGYDGYYDQDSDFIIAVHHMLFDEKGTRLYPYLSDGSKEEQARTQKIAALYADGQLHMQEGKGKPLKIDANTYYLMRRTYAGEYDGSFVVAEEKGQSYVVVAYMNVTPVAAFLHLVNRLLFSLVALLFLVTSVIFLSVGRRLDRSVQSLKSYILWAGERKVVSLPPSLPYAEFTEIADTVYEMSQKILEAESAQVKFFQNASHELRTPLTAIYGYAEGIHAGVIRDAKDAAATIMAHGEKMSALVDEILYLSKMDAQTVLSDEGRFDLREMVGRCAWQIDAKAEGAGLRLEICIGEAPVFIRGSEQMLERALANLLSNALRYARTRIAATVSVSDGQVFITVEDDGDGIAEEDLPHIYERFYTGRGGVTGIGLSIAQEAVRRHKGAIAVSSEPGHTVFTVRLPIDAAATV